jgi:hypothetical protein
VVDLVMAVAAILALSVGVVVLTGVSVSYPIAGSAVATGFGVAAFACILYRLVDPPGEGLDREIAAWLGLLAAAGIVVGGYLAMQE